MYPPLMSPQTPLVSVPSSSSVSGCSSKNTDAIFSCRWCCTLTTTTTIVRKTVRLLSVPYLQSLHRSRSYRSCHRRKRRMKSPWEPAGSCGSSSDSSWWTETGPPVSAGDNRYVNQAVLQIYAQTNVYMI